VNSTFSDGTLRIELRRAKEAAPVQSPQRREEKQADEERDGEEVRPLFLRLVVKLSISISSSIVLGDESARVAVDADPASARTHGLRPLRVFEAMAGRGELGAKLRGRMVGAASRRGSKRCRRRA